MVEVNKFNDVNLNTVNNSAPEVIPSAELEGLANNGDAKAAFVLAVMHAHGLEGEPDEDLALTRAVQALDNATEAGDFETGFYLSGFVCGWLNRLEQNDDKADEETVGCLEEIKKALFDKGCFATKPKKEPEKKPAKSQEDILQKAEELIRHYELSAEYENSDTYKKEHNLKDDQPEDPMITKLKDSAKEGNTKAFFVLSLMRRCGFGVIRNNDLSMKLTNATLTMASLTKDRETEYYVAGFVNGRKAALLTPQSDDSSTEAAIRTALVNGELMGLEKPTSALGDRGFTVEKKYTSIRNLYYHWGKSPDANGQGIDNE